MKRVFSIKNIDCANCATKIEDKINKINGVEEAVLNFMMEKLTVEFIADTDDEILKVIEEIKKVVGKIEPDAFFE